VAQETVGACYGDAMLAALATGLTDDPLAWNPITRTVRPDEGRTRGYERYYRAYRSLYDSTVDVAHFLAAEQHAADRV
jgi:xylulokinase